MTPSERLQLGVALCEAGDAVQRAAIRQQHPEFDEAEITFHVAIRRLGLEYARKIYGRV